MFKKKEKNNKIRTKLVHHSAVLTTVEICLLVFAPIEPPYTVRYRRVNAGRNCSQMQRCIWLARLPNLSYTLNKAASGFGDTVKQASTTSNTLQVDTQRKTTQMFDCVKLFVSSSPSVVAVVLSGPYCTCT